MPSVGRNPLTQKLIDWADLILVMEPLHDGYIHEHFKCKPGKVRILDVDNRYVRGDPELVDELKRKVKPILDMEDRLCSIYEKSQK